MDRAAKDDGERQRARSQLYAPPAGERRRNKLAGRRPGALTSGSAQALAAEVAAEDAALRRR